MRNTAKESEKLFITGFVLRFAPLYVRVQELLKDGFAGRIVNVEANEHLHPSHGAYIMRSPPSPSPYLPII